MTPSIGRIVHYVSYGTPGGEYGRECRAAIITSITEESAEQNASVSLFVMNPTGLFLNDRIEFDDERHDGGTWHWPERVD